MTELSPEFSAAFLARAGARRQLRFDAFVDLALYDPRVGYYRRERARVGYGPGTDFFTASTSGPVFGELIAAAAIQLLGGEDPRAYTFIEVGAESEGGILRGVSHPFGAARTIRVGETLEVDSRSVLFSNELLDAQPFRRVRFLEGVWQELGVEWHDGKLRECLFGAFDPPSSGPVPALPASVATGYTVDLPLAAARMTDLLVRGHWTGLFLAFDYGKSWRELVEAAPAGTARAYHRHQQSNDLLAQPGEQDLTCHVCWDWISAALQTHGFHDITLETQESFFVRHAEAYLAPAIAADAGRLTPRKQSLLQLLHGGHLGQKFQVVWGRREGRERG